MEHSVYALEMQKNTNTKLTENGAVEMSSTLSNSVDFFYGTLSTNEEYYSLFLAALAEDRELALKIYFWHRDIRNSGQGRRSNFRYVLSKADEWAQPIDFSANAIFNYGRTDDMLSLLDTHAGKNILEWIQVQIKAENPLVAKWLPRESSKKKNYKFYARRIANYMGWTSKQYRKNISKMTAVVEQQMCAKEWGSINFSHVPSQAALRYKDCFTRNATESYLQWQANLSNPESTDKVNSQTLLPHQIVEKYGFLYPKLPDLTLEAMWTSIEKVENNCLVIADTSGSMSGTPMAVSIALALYFSETNPFGGFITFSERPRWHKFDKSHTLYQKLDSIESINCCNTNLEATFALLFETYRSTKMMPEQIIIVSDMQFDVAIGSEPGFYSRKETLQKRTFFKKMKRKFTNHNVPFPKIIFWNVREDIKGSPVSFDETGTALIAGYNPLIMNTVMSLENFDPELIMKEAVKNINPKL